MASTVTQQSIPSAHRVPFDIVLFGVVMILSGFGDIYIIIANPEYALPIFGMKLAGLPGWTFKLIHPVIHFASGYGAILGKRWAYVVFMAYSIYGLVNASVNRMVLPGPHRIRTVFFFMTLAVMGYLYWRRDCRVDCRGTSLSLAK